MALARRRTASHRFVTSLQQRAVVLAMVAAVFLIGSIVGGVSVNTLDTAGTQELRSYLQDSLTRLAHDGPGYDSWQWVLVDEVIKPAGLIWVLGMSVIGVPLIAVVVFMRGFVFGFSLVFLLKALVLRGVAFVVVALIPQNILSIPGLILVAAGAVVFSGKALQIVLGRPGSGDIYRHLRTEGAVALLGCLLLAAGGVVATYITPGMTGFVSRWLL